MKKISIDVHINGSRHSLTSEAGAGLPEILRKNHISFATPCGGYGTCGKCKVRFLTSAPAPAPADIKQLSDKELKHGYRLACQHTPVSDTELSLDSALVRGPLHILTHGLQPEVVTDSDIPLKGKTGPVYGAAVDLGTSTIVASLIDLRSGERTGPVSAPNPQAEYGSDIITRATAALSSEKVREALRELAAGAINRLLQRLHKDTGQIYRLVLGGNAVMTHLFAGEPLDALMTAPYRSAFTDMRTFAARETGLRLHPAAKVTVLPAIGSFIGGDISADLLVCRELFNGKKNLFLMDLGTNCELVLQSPNGVKAASAPAGPVMEGAGIAYGMSAGPGAITDLVYDRKKRFLPVTVGNKRARGICGSGLIHVIHLLWSMGMILPQGRFSADAPFTDPEKGFTLAENVRLTPGDIRAFQMAKSAITASWKLLFSLSNFHPEDLDCLVLAGAFGHYIRPETGMELGLFPRVANKKFIYLGNGSLSGCEMVLKNKAYAERIQAIASEAEHVEMAGREDFQEMYALNMGLGRDVYEK